MNDYTYSRTTVIWIIRNLLELRQGIAPDPKPDHTPPIKQKGNHAPFEVLSGMAGIIEQKLNECGNDGIMTKISYVMGETDETLARIGRCSVRAVSWRIDKVIGYISGKPKERSYLAYRDHRKGEG